LPEANKTKVKPIVGAKLNTGPNQPKANKFIPISTASFQIDKNIAVLYQALLCLGTV